MLLKPVRGMFVLDIKTTKDNECRLMDGSTINPTMRDVCICPFCENDTFYATDYGREFCSKCRREVRVNSNFKGGKLLDK